MQTDFKKWLSQITGKIEAGYIDAALRELEGAADAGAFDADYWLLRGAALGKLTRTEESLSCFERALHINPLHEVALFNSAEALRFLGEQEQALAVLGRGVELFPASAQWLHRLWWAERQVCDWQGREAALSQGIEQQTEVDPFAALLLGLPESVQQVVAAQRAKREAASVGFVSREGEPPVVDRPRLRIGWLSADFHDHATMYLMLEVLERLNRQRFEQVFYSFGPDFEDECRKRVRACGQFVDVTAMGAVEAAQRIANDGIDILIDLKGYTAFARAAILALRPAPVQVQWLGYPGSMAAPWIDWIVADAHVLPGATLAASPAGYTERVVYLPHSYQPNDAVRLPAQNLPQTLSRAQVGLPEGAVVLANFNNPYKTDAAVWAVWMSILQAVPRAVLWLFADQPLTRRNLMAQAEQAGVDPQRLIFAPKWERGLHLQRLALADLALDPLAMGGHTTTSDALRVGLPVLTVTGRTFGRRVAASLLQAAGLPECVFATPDALRKTAIGWGNNPAALRQLRAKAELARLSGDLFDPSGFAVDLGRALQGMWQYKREGLTHRLLDLRKAVPAPKLPPLGEALKQLQANLSGETHSAAQLTAAQDLACSLLRAYPASANVCAMLALVRYRQNRHDESALLFAAALARVTAPSAQTEHNMASSLESGGHHALAEAAYRRALALEPQRKDTLGQLGCLLRNIGRVDEALVLHKQALDLQPHDAQTTYIYGGSLYQAGQIAPAMQTLQQALVLEPALHEARSNLGICHLLRGEFELGWEAFEHRWHSPQMKGSWAPFPAPAWQGEDLNGRAFLGWAEQGLGDNIQFVRYFALLRQRYPSVRLAFWGPRTIFRLIEGFAKTYQIQLVAREDAPQPAQVSGMDFHAPLMGLPRLMGTRLDNIPSSPPAYLSLAPEWLAPWRARLAALDAALPAHAQRPLNVGLVWSGQLEGVMVEKRNIHIAKLEAWLAVANVRWFSLQIGAAQAAQVLGTKWEDRLVDWTADIHDFADTASFARTLDLVIAVDTSTVHAAAATGTPVWMLSRFDGCWRWLQERTDTPWYPSMTIWRQARPLAWEPVITAVKTALAQRVLDKQTQSVMALCEQGRTLRQQGQVAQALALYDQAMAWAPDRAEPWLLKGFALRMQNDFAGAEHCYREALVRDPRAAQSHFNLAIILLMQRRYAEGWLAYAWRWQMPGHVHPALPGKRWQGEGLAGRRLLVFQEQGFGDAVQFLRFVQVLVHHPAHNPAHAKVHITVAVRAPLLRLLRASLGTSLAHEVVLLDDASTLALSSDYHVFDYHASLLDLPRLLQVTDECAAQAQCLQVEPALRAQWQSWLAAQGVPPAQGEPSRRRRMGLVWSGNPDRLRNDHRSMPASVLQALRALPSEAVQWVSLQVAVPSSDVPVLADWSDLVQPLALLGDFADTAALILSLDVVVTVDTSVAHLAAALGKPTWVLVCFDSDWRWQLQRQDSPWYPSVRLFRQAAAGDWPSLVAQVADAIIDG